MARKIMLEVTQPVVDGNEVVVAAGELFEPGAQLPDGVTVREVVTDAPDEPAKAAEPAKTEPAKAPPAKAPAK
jgi:hypothetical protein